MEEKKVYAVQVDGQTVPTWEAQEALFSQMMAQSCRIDRSNAIAWTALILGLIDVALRILPFILGS